MSAITALQLTSSAINSDADYKRVEGKGDGKIADTYYLYVKRGDADPITGLAVTHDDKQPGDNYVKLETNLTKTSGKFVYLWYQHKGTGSPIIELKFITSDDNVVGPGFNRISEELNPDSAGAKEYLTFKTKAAQQKLDARDFKAGDLVDCIDTSNAWLVARVVNVDPKEDRVLIHFEGWDAKWDEWISRRSPRIASHGSHTGGKWTGNRASREPWVMRTDLENFAVVTKRAEAILAICEAKCKELGPKLVAVEKDEKARAVIANSLALSAILPRDEFTFIVQDDFRYVMNVLNATIDDKSLYPIAQHFIEVNLKLMIHALKFEPELHVAIQNIYLLVMCADLSFQKYYAEYGRTHDDKTDLTPPFAHRVQFTEEARSLVSALLVQSINVFGTFGGFDAVMHRLHHPERYRDSFFSTAKIIQGVAGIRNVLNPKWGKPYILSLNLPDLVQSRLAKVTDDDLKTLDKEQLGLLSANVLGLLQLVLEPPKQAEFSERSSLTICLRLLNSGVLAKRLDGVVQLEMSLASLRPRDAHPPGFGQPAPVPPAQFINNAFMVNWITENKVLDVLLARDSHEQVIKRTPPVLKFLSQQNALKPAHVSLLWSAGVGKTDAVVRIVYDTLADLSQELSEEHLDELFKKILEKKTSEYRDFDLKFIRDFTINAVHHVKPELSKDKNKWYGLDIFWQLLQGGSDVVPPNIGQLASTYLTNLLAQPQFQSQLSVYLDKCMKTLHSGSAGAVLQALRLAHLIVEVAAPDQATKGKHSKEEVIAKLEKDHKLLAALVADTSRYRAEANKAVAAASTAADTKSAATTAVVADPLVGGHPHSAHVQVRFDFLDFVLVNTGGELRLDQKFVDTLWDAYVTSPVHPNDRARCLAWLGKAIVKNDKKGKSILASLSGYIFNQLLCNESKINVAALTPEGWVCFETFFVELNCLEDALVATPRIPPVVINYSKLIGLDALWSIATRATHPDVSKFASTFLTALHIRLDWALAAKEKKNIFKSFVDKCMANLKANFQKLKQLRAGDAKAADAKSSEAECCHRVVQLLAVMDEYLARMQRNELIPRPRFQEGMKIIATWMRQNTKFNAEVKKINRDCTYVVLYADGDQDVACPERNMYFIEGSAGAERDRQRMDAKGALSPEDDYAGLAATPRTLLSNEQQYFDLLFDLLGVGGDVARLVIKLLNRLPVNQGLSDTIKNLSTAKSVDWNQLLPRDSVMKLSYTLRIVRQQVIPPPLPQVAVVEGGAPDPTATAQQAAILAVYTNWSEMFLHKGGFAHLAAIFMQTRIEDMLASSLTQECLFHVLELINYFIGSPHLSKQSNPHFEHEKALRHLMPSLEAIVALPLPAEPKQTPEQKKNAPRGKDGQLLPNPEVELEKQIHANLVQYALHSVLLCAIQRPALLDSVLFPAAATTPTATNWSWDKILLSGLLHRSPYIRKVMVLGLGGNTLCAFPQAHTALLPKLLSMIGQLDTMAHSSICSEYFELCSAELKRANTPPVAAAPATIPAAGAGAEAKAVVAVDAKSAAAPALYDAAKLVANLCEKIKNQPVLEISPNYIDHLLCGLFQLTEQLVSQNPKLKEPLGTSGLIADVLQCLFDAPKGGRTPGVLPPPKCKNAKTRKDAYTLLNQLAIDCPANRRRVMEAVAPYHLVTHSSLTRSDDWAFEARSEEKSQTGYLGLVNLACICYQNSNLQQLFMVPRFRANILAVDQYKDENLAESMVYQLQHLFGTLQESEKLAANPVGFVHTYKGEDGKPVDPRVQEDSGEFLRKVLDRLSTGLKGTKYANAVKDVFGGVLVNQKIGRGPCNHFKERDEEFFGVQIQVKDKKTLEEGLATFVAGDVMEGSEAVRCDACAKKVPVLMRQVFKRLPPTLIVVLKRFEMNFETMDIAKLNSKLEFPFKLNLKPYCQETLVLPKGHIPVDAPTAATATATPAKPADGKSADGKSGADAKGKTAESTAGATKVPESPARPQTPPIDAKPSAGAAVAAPTGPLHPDEYYEYVLRGMVVHTGSAHGGHYYSFIQERLEGEQEGKWYEFNDTRVSPFNPDQIPEECFGGVEEGRHAQVKPAAGADPAAAPAGYERSRNAYILYYDRVKPKVVAPSPTDASATAASTAVVPASDKSTTGGMAGAVAAKLNSMKQAAKVLQVVAKQRKATRALRARAQLQPTMFKEIWKQNLTYWRDRAVFDKAYFDFLWQVLDKVPPKPKSTAADEKVVLALPPTSGPVEDHIAAAMLGTRFTLMTLAHAKEGKDFLNSFMLRLKRLYESDLSIGLWLLQEMFNNETFWACDFLLTCPEEAVRNNVADVVCKILTLVSPHEQRALQPDVFETVTETVTSKSSTGEVSTVNRQVRIGAGHAVRFINALIERLLNLAPQYWRTFDPYFRVLSHFASLGQAETAYLIRRYDLLARLIDLFVGERSSHPEVNQFAVDPKGRRVAVGMEGYRPADLGHLMILIKQLVVASQQPVFDTAAARPATPPTAATAAADGKSAPNAQPSAAQPAATGADAKSAPAVVSAAAAAAAKVNATLLPLSKAANDLLLGSNKGEFLSKLLAYSTFNRRSKPVSAIVQHLCRENEKVTSIVIATISGALLEYDYDGVRAYFRTMMRLISMDDSLHVARTNATIDMLVTVVHKQSKYWKITDFCLEHLIRMARKSQTVRAWLLSHPKLCDNMIGWLHTYPEPPPPAFHHGMRGPAASDESLVLLKPQSEQNMRGRGAGGMDALDMSMSGRGMGAMRRGAGGAIYGVPDAEARNPYANAPTGLNPIKKMEILQIIRAGKEVDGPNAVPTTDAGNASDSDIDFSERTFKLNELVDCADSVNKWLVARIIRVDGNRVELNYVGWPDKWNETLDVADKRLRALGTTCNKEQIAAAHAFLAKAAATATAAATTPTTTPKATA